MTEIKRITPDQVLNAYRTQCIRPIRDTWARYTNDGERCGCGLTAVLVDKGGPVAFSRVFLIKAHIPHVVRELGLSRSYVVGFVRGFDDDDISDGIDSHSALGHADGKAAWEAVSRAYGL